MGRGELLPYAWVAAVGGAIVLGLVAVLVFRTGVMIATALQGSAMIICGLISMLFKFDSISEGLYDKLSEHPPVLPLIIVGVGLAGMIGQFVAAERDKKRKKQEKTKATKKG